MALYRYDRRVHYDELVQRVRRHAPSSLLPLVAKAGSTYMEPSSWLRSPYQKFTPWALAEIARISIHLGNENRKPAADSDLLECCTAYAGIADPELGEKTLDVFAKFMLRMAFQQLDYNSLVRHELARSIALFGQTKPTKALQVIRGDWWHHLLGCTVTEYIAVAFLFYAGAPNTAGTFDLDWIDQSSFAEIRDQIPAATIRMVAFKHFIATQDALKALQPAPDYDLHRDLWRYRFNPLEARPIIAGVNERLLIPVPPLLVRKVSSIGLYHTGREKWGDPFTQDLGDLFEAYVGNQLKLLESATVLRSIGYTYKKNRLESVDWIVLFENVTLLVEVKSTRPTEAVRVGSDRAVEDLKGRLKKAVNQINTTAELIANQHPAFTQIEPDRPIVGLVVTMEQFHVINASPYRALLPSSPHPIRMCSASELEHLVTVTSRSVGELLQEFVADQERQDWSIGSILEPGSGLIMRRNKILDQAFAELP